MCLLLLAAGHETTSNLIGNGTLALFEHPDQLDWLAQHPDLSLQAVNELLRYDSPVQVASRVALNDLVLGGVSVRAGQQALVVLGAANRDPARYPDPDRLDLTRTGPPHLAFGNGPHFCVGAGLARLEAQETFTRLAQSGVETKGRLLVAPPGALPHLPAAAKPQRSGRALGGRVGQREDHELNPRVDQRLVLDPGRDAEDVAQQAGGEERPQPKRRCRRRLLA